MRRASNQINPALRITTSESLSNKYTVMCVLKDTKPSSGAITRLMKLSLYNNTNKNYVNPT